MNPSPLKPRERAEASAVPDEELARRVAAGETELFELLMRRHNQKVYRAVRSLIRDEADVEDVMQQAYVSAFQHLRQFQGSARLSTWLVRIAVNEALMRLRRANRFVALDGAEPEEVIPVTNRPTRASPEEQAARRELVGLVERAVDELPELYRSVFVLRDVEGMSTAESAEVLELSEEVIKTRLHRAKALLREKLASFAEPSLGSAFPFEAPRCDRVVIAVMERIRGSS